MARETLRAWQEKNHPWLELSDVHRETTENIRVTVIPFYMGMREAQNSHVYWWRYCIRLENLDSDVVQLRERHWRIFSLSGTLETVRGRGWWAGNQCYPRSSPPSSTAATSPCRPPVGTCGALSASRGLMVPTLTSGSLPSPWKAIKMRRHRPQAFIGRPAEALSTQAPPRTTAHIP